MTDDLRLLEEILSTGETLTAEQIAYRPPFLRAHPGVYTRTAEGIIGAAASESGAGILSFPGAQGYKLTRFATEDEIRQAVATFRHQCGVMQGRADAYERALKQRLAREERQLVLV
jgi:hypothetical protein